MSWPQARFGDLYLIPSRNGLSRPSRVRGEGIKMVNMGELFANQMIGDIPMERVPMNERELANSSLAEGDLLFARQSLVLEGAGQCSYIASLPEPTTFESHLIRVRLDQAKAIPLFYHYYFRSPYSGMSTIVQQCAQAGIRASELAELKVGYPPLDVQKAVVDLLAAYDDLIENNRRRMSLLEESARLLYREWFVRLRFPGYEHTPIVDGVPQGWERVPLEAALVLQRGFDLPTQDRQEGDVPIYGSTGILGYHDKAKAVAPGVVTGRSGTLGEVQYVGEDYWPLNTALWVKEFKRVTPLFALFLLREMDLKQFNGGASVPTLDRKSVHRVEIVIPSAPMLRSFDEFAADVYEQIKNLNVQNQKLRAARDLLLPRLMSGELAV